MNTQPHHRRYCGIVFGLGLGFVFAIALMNFLVDPYNRFGVNTLGIYISAEREAKPNLYKDYESDVILLGDSRSGLMDTSPINTKRVFNFAFGGGNIAESHSVAYAYADDVELVVLGIGLGKVERECDEFDDPLRPISFDEAMQLLVSIKTAEYSIKTIARSLSGDPSMMAASGSPATDDWAVERDADNPAKAAVVIQQLVEMVPTGKVPPDAFEMLERLQGLLDERGVPLVIFIYPMHPQFYAEIEGTPKETWLEEWKRQFLERFPDALDFSASEKYAIPENFFLSDPLHFRSEVGTQLLKEEILPYHYGDALAPIQAE